MKILMLSKDDFIEKQNQGGLACRFRNYYLLQKAFGKENVFLCCVVSNHKPSAERKEYIMCKDSVCHRYLQYIFLRDGITRKAERKICQVIYDNGPFDGIFYDGSTWGNIAKKFKNYKSIVFFHNIERQYTWGRVKEGSWLCMPRYFATRYCEAKQVKYAKGYICLNERDRQLLHKFYKKNADLILPITFQDTYKVKNIREVKAPFLLFVGSYFGPNISGIRWFIEKVMPEININLKIVGRGMEKIKNSLERERVEVIGSVEDVTDYYLDAAAVVMPIFTGGGMKVKTAEAMMYGKTIFATDEALEGYNVENVDGVYRCKNKDEFIQKISENLGHIKQYKINTAVREYFTKHLETDSYIPVFKNTLEKI